MEKIPCIKCTSKLWEYIKPYLEEFGYKPGLSFDSNWTSYPILAINSRYLDVYTNINFLYKNDKKHILVNNVEEFLEKAARLKGKTYKRKDVMKINGIEIKPGMIITCENSADYIAFPTKKGLAFVSIFANEWTTTIPENIITIRDLVEDGYITSGKILWKKPKEIVLTMDEIAKKFGCPVEQIKIKK